MWLVFLACLGPAHQPLLRLFLHSFVFARLSHNLHSIEFDGGSKLVVLWLLCLVRWCSISCPGEQCLELTLELSPPGPLLFLKIKAGSAAKTVGFEGLKTWQPDTNLPSHWSYETNNRTAERSSWCMCMSTLGSVAVHIHREKLTEIHNLKLFDSHFSRERTDNSDKMIMCNIEQFWAQNISKLI